tara:strand:- start:11 stop:244 length:234 start_codon:yes stop_codon:yes gene_type:complete
LKKTSVPKEKKDTEALQPKGGTGKPLMNFNLLMTREDKSLIRKKILLFAFASKIKMKCSLCAYSITDASIFLFIFSA